MPMAAAVGLEVTFSSERSVQDELNRESYTDAFTVAASYVAMFVYISFAMTQAPKGVSWQSLLVHSRAGLSAAGAPSRGNARSCNLLAPRY